MAGPVIAATATRVAAFSPLLFWPGIVGEFMKYMPLTLIATLSASLVVALFFTPTLGAMLGRAGHGHEPARDNKRRDRGLYMRIVKLALHHPLVDARRWPCCCSSAVVQAYGQFGNGVEFFPNIEPDYGLVQVRARGNLSIQEKDELVRRSSSGCSACRRSRPSMRAPAKASAARNEVTEDTVGTVQFEFVDWKERRKASVIIDEIRAMTKDIPGVIIEVTKPQGGPPTGKPITLEISSVDPELLYSRPPARSPTSSAPIPTRATSTTACRSPASTGTLDVEQGRGGEVRRQPRSPSAPPSSSSPTA